MAVAVAADVVMVDGEGMADTVAMEDMEDGVVAMEVDAADVVATNAVITAAKAAVVLVVRFLITVAMTAVVRVDLTMKKPAATSVDVVEAVAMAVTKQPIWYIPLLCLPC